MRPGILTLVLLVLSAACASDPALRPHAAARQRSAADSAVEPVVESPPAQPEPTSARAASGPLPATEASTTPGDAPSSGLLAAPIARLTAASVISRFGDPRDGGRRRHEGVDLAAPRGTPVLAPRDGSVVVSGTRSLGGNVVVLVDDERRYEFVFSHLDARRVRRGERVVAGQQLGTVGTTGNAAGGPPHLHFEVRLHGEVLDPYPLLLGGGRVLRGQ